MGWARRFSSPKVERNLLLFRFESFFNSPFRVNVGSQTMCFPYHPNDPNLIPSSMTGMGGISKKCISRAATCNALPMAHAEQVRCLMVRAYQMSVDCVVSHLMNFPINLRCSEMIVCLIMMLLNSQMLTSCLTMILSFAEESSSESCWGLHWDETLLVSLHHKSSSTLTHQLHFSFERFHHHRRRLPSIRFSDGAYDDRWTTVLLWW